MSPLEWLAQPAGRVLTLALMHFLWQGLLIVMVLGATVELGRIRRAASRYACSLAALAAMTVCPVVTLAWLSMDHAQQTSPVVALLDDAAGGSDRASIAAPFLWIDAAQPHALGAWFLGVLVFGSRLLAGVVGLARLRRSRLPLPAELSTRVERLGRRFRIDATRFVFLSRRVTEAMAVGVVRPLILLPAAWAVEMPPQMLEAVIAHELAHLRRRDLWVILAQRVVETVLFYHPAVWWLSRRLRIERELCADEMAVAATGERLLYAQTLEQVARERRADGRTSLAAFMQGEKDMRLLHRVRNVLGQSSTEQARLWPAGVLSLALPVLLWAATPGGFSAVGTASADERAPADSRGAEAGLSDLALRIALVQQESDDRDPEGERTVRRRREVEARDRAVVDRASNARIEELTVLVKRLAAQVDDLQAEVAKLRGEKGTDKAPTASKLPAKRKPAPSEDAEEPKPRIRKLPAAAEPDDVIIERKLDVLIEPKVRAAQQNLERKLRAAAESGRDVIVDKEAIRRAVEQALEAAEKSIDKEAIQRSVEQALEAAKKGGEQAREAAVKAKEQALEAAEKAKEKALEAVERAKRAKEEAERREEEKP